MKAQLKMAESIIVLVIFIFLIMFGLIFYVNWARMQNSNASGKVADLNALKVALKVKHLPEIQASREHSIEVYSVDWTKLMAFRDVDKRSYRKAFPNTVITVTQVYPIERSEQIFDASPALKRSYQFFPIPVTVFDPYTRTYGMGYLNVTVYS